MTGRKTKCSADDDVILTGVCHTVEVPVHPYFSNQDARLHLTGRLLEYQ